MSGSNRNMTRGRTQPPPSGGASASSANIGEELSSDLGNKATDDAGATDDAKEEATANPEEVTESISGSLAVNQTRTASGSSADADPFTNPSLMKNGQQGFPFNLILDEEFF